MKIQKSIFFILGILLFSQFTLINAYENQLDFNSDIKSLAITQPKNNKDVEVNAPSGTEKVKSNIIRNGGFEEEDTHYGPNYFSYSGYTFGYANSSYQDDVHSGSYCGYLSSQGTNQFYSSYSNSRSLIITTPYAYLNQMLYLDLWINIKNNPDISSGANTNLRVRFNTAGGSYNLYYYFSSASLNSNSTNNAFFDVRKPLNNWYNIQRNLTYDVEQAFGSYDSTWHIRTIYLYAQSVINPTGAIIVLLDDFSIKNSTTYNYLSDNGDFEDGDNYPWSNYRYCPGYAYLTSDDYLEGTKALNLSAASIYDNAIAYIDLRYQTYFGWAYEPKGYYPLQPENVLVNFKWKYTPTDILTAYQYSMFYIILQNSTFSVYINYLLGINSALSPFSNQTYPTAMYLYLKANDFNVNDIWHQFSMDIYTIVDEMNLKNLVLTYVGFTLNTAYNSESRIQLLVDALEVITYPTGDPSFEEIWNWHYDEPIHSWEANNYVPYINLTTNAHTGKYALNITNDNLNADFYVYRTFFLPVQPNLFTDFWWRLDNISGASYTYSIITLSLDSTNNIHYVIGSTSGTIFNNDSSNVYYYVENYNQTGVWFNLFRSVSNDATTAFGFEPWNITYIAMICYINSLPSKISILFDDIHFARDITPPELSDLTLIPTIPQYGQNVAVEVTASDNVELFSVVLSYKVFPGSFIETPMTYNGAKFIGEIPAALWNTTVRYFITARDIANQITSIGNDTHPLSYVTQDFVDPILDVESPPINESLVGDVQFNITGNDVGSGIGSFIISIGNETLYDNSTVPPTYVWQTKDYVDGQYTINFTLTDKADNFVSLTFTYTLENTPIINFILKWWPYLTAGAGALILGIVVIAIVIKVKKH